MKGYTMRSFALACSLLLITSVLAARSPAAEYTVAPDGSGPYATIQDALDETSDGDIITLLEGTFTGPGNRDLYVGTSVTIRSDKSYAPSVIDCQGSAADPHRGFSIEGGSATLEYLIIRNGYADLGGAVLANSGSPMVIDHCILADNVASADGGAVYADGTEVSLTFCTVFHNEATRGSGIFLVQGAVARLDNSIVAFGMGGAACSDYYGGGFVVGCSDIYGNWGGDWTGNLAAQLGVNNNVAVDPGFLDPMGTPAIYSPDAAGALQFVPCGMGAVLRDWFVDPPVYTILADGRGMYPTIQAALDAVPYKSIVALAPGIFTGDGNRDIELRGKDVTVRGRTGDPADVIIDVAASAGDYHRGFYVHEGESSSVSVADLTIRNGYCSEVVPLLNGGTGGAILLANRSSLTVYNCRFENNTVQGIGIIGNPRQTGRGAAIHAYLSVYTEWPYSDTLALRDCTFINNTGGEAVLVDSGYVTITGCTFAENDGGVKAVSAAGGVRIRNTLFESFDNFGLEVLGTDATVTVDSCQFRNATGTKTAIHVNAGADVTFSQCDIDQVQALGADARAPVLVTGSDVTFTDCLFTGNSGPSSGALYFDGGTLAVDGCFFADNSSGLDGGAVYLATGLATLGNCRFEGNQSVQYGGGVYAVQATAVLDSCIFSENTTGEAGGGLATLLAQTTLNACEFVGCSSGAFGGGTHHINGSTRYNGGRIVGNRSVSGGGMTFGGATGEINDMQIVGNSADRGGGMTISASNIAVNNSEIVANEAAHDGGLYMYFDNTVVISNTLIARNTASTSLGSGVGVYTGSDLTFLGSTISGNSGAGSWAQILAAEGSSLAFSACIVSFGGDAPAVAVLDSSTVQIETSDVFGNYGGDWTGPLAGLDGTAYNFSLDPRFCDRGMRNYHLDGASPCVGANNPSGLDVGAYGTGCSGVSGVTQAEELPRSFVLYGNSPNPFNPRTTISFDLPADSSVTLEIYDVSGRRVRMLVGGLAYVAGRHHVTWDGADDEGQVQSSGVYLYRLTAGRQSSGGKMALLR